MISRLRDGTPVESYDNQAGIIRFLYSTAPGRFLLRPLIRPRFSKFMGHVLNSGISRVLVGPFIRKNHISMEDYPPRRYRSFNDFFTRTILPERRPVDPEPEHLIAPCDSKLSAIALEPDTRFYIKGVAYTAGDLLRSEELAKRFAGGWLLLFRLTVDDYHHYLYPLSGTESTRVVIPGVFHTVNPYAAGIPPSIGRTPGNTPAPRRNSAPSCKWRWARCWWAGSPITRVPGRCSGARKRACLNLAAPRLS